MEVIRGIIPCLKERFYVTIGVFDGLHLGHHQLISLMVNEAKKKRRKTLLITFDPHPLKIILPERSPLLLLSLEERLQFIRELGISKTFILSFDSKLASMDGERFLREILLQNLNIEKIFVGKEYLFGKERRGNLELLKRIGKEYGFEAVGISPYKIGGEVVSSTKVREYLLKGMVDRAEMLLGRPHSIKGKVKRGTGRGKEIGYPTANLLWPKEILLPGNGVYAVYVMIDGKALKGISYIGFRPTFKEKERSFEVHIFGFNGLIYGKEVRVLFKAWIRGEFDFRDIHKLKAQLKEDTERALHLLEDQSHKDLTFKECGVDPIFLQ
jgi:riboflavin kinase/FMN adenylyltransferase